MRTNGLSAGAFAIPLRTTNNMNTLNGFSNEQIFQLIRKIEPEFEIVSGSSFEGMSESLSKNLVEGEPYYYAHMHGESGMSGIRSWTNYCSTPEGCLHDSFIEFCNGTYTTKGKHYIFNYDEKCFVELDENKKVSFWSDNLEKLGFRKTN